MDRRNVKIAMALKAELKRNRKETRLMKELLRASEAAVQEKAKECEMLKRKKQRLLAVEADKEKVVHDFMLFLEAAVDHHKNDDTKNSPKFDEKTMKNTILTMMNGGGGHGGYDGGFAVDDGAKKEA